MSQFEREPREDKVVIVDDLKQALQSSSIILTDYQGLSIKQLSDMRNKLRESNSGYKVVKNTLFRLAAKGTPAEALNEEIAGPTAMVFSDDPVAAAKTIQEFTKGQQALVLKSAVVDGQVLNVEQIQELAKIPPRDILYAMVVGGIQSPISGLVCTLQQLYGQLVFTLQAVADKKAA